jgi:hypothetical protein
MEADRAASSIGIVLTSFMALMVLASSFLFLLPRHHPGVREKLLPGVYDCLLAYCFVGVTGDLQALSCLVSINQQFHQFFSSRPVEAGKVVVTY